MMENYIEIFLGISIGVFVLSLVLLASMIKKNLRTKPVCESVQEEAELHALPAES